MLFTQGAVRVNKRGRTLLKKKKKKQERAKYKKEKTSLGASWLPI